MFACVVRVIALCLFFPFASSALPSPTQVWLEAAVKGDVKKMKSIIESNAQFLNAMDEATGRTAALGAALNGQANVLTFLMEKGADVQKPFESKSGMTALDAAVEYGYSELVQLLLPHTNPNEENHKDGLRPIHRAASGTENGHVAIIKMLLNDNRVGANDISRENFSPLGHALRSIRANQFRQPLKLNTAATTNKREIVQTLLQHGGDANELTDDDIRTLGLSFREIEDWKKRSPVKRKIPDFRFSYSPDERMLEAVQREDWEWVQHEIQQNGANVNVRHPSNKQTAFMTACLKGDVKTARKLHELGADPKIGEAQGYTPFHGAGFQGHADIAKFLLEELKLDPNHLHKDGFRPIHRACWGKQARHSEFVRYLLSTGKVDPDSPTSKGLTPLQVLVSHETYRNSRTARVLVDFGADVSKLKESEIEILKLSSADDFETCPVYATSS